MTAGTDRDRLRGKLSNVLCNAANYPERAQVHLWGTDMGPLLDKTADAILAEFLPAHDTQVRAEGVEAASEELVRRDQFSERTLRILDELAAAIRAAGGSDETR